MQPDCTVQIQRASQLLSDRKPREAQALALASIRECPGNAVAYNLLGLSYDAETRFTEAQRAYLKAIELNPKGVSFHDNLAVSYLRSGNQESGLREFQKALGLEPRDQTANLNLAAYSLSRKQYSRAIRYFDAARAEASQDPSVLLGMIQAYFGAGDSSAGRALAAKLSTLGGSDARIHFSLGLLLAQSGEYQMAVKEFQAIAPDQRDFATALNLGMAYSNLRRYAEARQNYEEAARLDPSSPEPYLRTAMDVAGDDANGAIYWIMQAQERAPERADISNLLAEQLIRVGNYERADDTLASALRRHGEDSRLWEALGDLRSRQKRVQDAVDAYLRCLRFDPADVSARLALAEVYRTSGRTEASSGELQKVLHVQPDNPKANADLARIAFDRGQQQEALHLAQRSLAVDANNLTANEIFAQLMIRDKKLALARSTLDKLVKLDPGNPRFHYLLSRVLFKLDLPQEAQNEVELSKKLGASGKTPISR